MRILPAIDLLAGNVVTLVEGRPGTETTSLPNPLEVAARWIREGAEWLHVVDLDAAFGRGDHRLAIQRILETRQAHVQVAGGLRSSEQIRWYLERGAERVVVGTRGIEDPSWLAEAASTYPDRLVLAVDARKGRIVTRGWTHETGLDVVQFLRRAARLPLAGILFTSVDVEGHLRGIDHDAIVQVLNAASQPLTVAGGVTSYDDLRFLRGLGVEAVVLGAALYQERIRLAQAMNLVMGV